MDEMNAVQTENNKGNLKTGEQPDQPGDNLKVFRFDTDIAWAFYDEDNGLWAFVSVDIFDFCADLPSFDLVSFQEIVQEEGDDFVRIVQQIKGTDVNVSVWDVPVPFDCSLMESNEPLFVGTGSFVYTDNDLNPDGQNANTWGLRLRGEGISVNFHAFVNAKGDNFRINTNIHLK